MRRMRNLRFMTAARAASLAALLATAMAAAEATPAQILAIKPSQPGVQCDTPAADTLDKCKVEIIQKPGVGYQLTDSRGLVVRRILDTNGDGAFDQWSFYLNGQEVYRDFDTKGAGRPNNHRWFLSGGSRWGVDENGDGKIDYWKSISPEEASAEAVAAASTADFSRMRLVLVSDADLRSLGLDDAAVLRAKKAADGYADRFKQLTSELPKTAAWLRLDKQNPMTVPSQDKSAQDLVLYSNPTIIAEVDNQPRYLRTAEIVKVGEAWKLTDVPAVMDPSKPVAAVSVLMPSIDGGAMANAATPNPAASNIEDKPEIQQFIGDLEKLDLTLGDIGDDPKRMAAYHKKRHELCAGIAAKSDRLKNREFWYRQAADSLNAAVQTGEFDSGVGLLNEYAASFAKVEWGRALAPYFKYRAINAALGLELHGNPENHEKAQAAFLTQVREFVEAYPKSEDAPDAFWQLGNSLELSGKEEEAVGCYKQIVKDFGDNRIAGKAAGALRRIEGVGQPVALSGQNLINGSPLDVSQLRGKYVVVSYWATFCEPCKAEMPRLEKLRQRYAGKNFEVLGVCLDQSKETAQQFLRQNKYSWPQLHDEGSLDSAPAVQYGIISLPYMMIVDPDGRVVKRNVQFAQLESDIESLLARKLTSQPGEATRKQ